MCVLHIDTGQSWRGGQRQTLLHLRYLREMGWVGMLLARPSCDLWMKAGALGILCFPWPAGDGRLKALGVLWRILNTYKPALVQLNDSKGLLPAMLLRRLFSRIKIIAVRRVLFPVDRLSVKWLYRPLDQIVCVSSAIHGQMCRNGLPPDQLEMIPSGVDLDALKKKGDFRCVRERLKIPRNSFHIGHIGHLSPEKGQAILLEAAHGLRTISNLFFSFLGGGDLLSDLKERAEQLGVAKQTRFLGHREDFVDYLASLDLYVQPSLTEGLGSAVIDAMGTGLPVIGSRVGGIPELLRDGVGRLVPPGDPQALANAIAELVQAPDRRVELGSLAMVRAQNYDFRKTNQRLLELYRELLN